jgi:thiamine pyrophosphate-dependent acetolactate synthase large subunit-like protein
MPDRATRPNVPPGPAEVERPQPSESQGIWASDVVADVLRALEIPYAALNPGASYRGLHDSIVNHLGNQKPQMLLCLHEEHAVAIAHGWAKVRETPMAAIVHSNVGLMHATMAVFNAWCDRVPLLLLGATGPVDAAKRRPWIDWIHTAKDQGALIRPYSKWDDQPASAEAAIESLLRAHLIARTAPRGPTYVCLDAGLQETKLDVAPEIPDVSRYQPPRAAAPDAASIEQAATLLAGARRPLILAGRVGRSEAGWAQRIQLAETLGAVVVTDLKAAAAFPNTHRLHIAPAGVFPSEQTLELLRAADVVLALDWIDLAGTLKAASTGKSVSAKLIHVSLDQHLHNGWSMDHQGLAPVDLYLMSDPDPTVAALLGELGRSNAKRRATWVDGRPGQTAQPAAATADGPAITVAALATKLREATSGRDVSLIRVPTAWADDFWPIQHPLDYLGGDGGGGLASGPGIAVGAALALRGTSRLPIAVLGDGDFLMGATALWTAVHYGIPLLVVVANNQSYYNDEIHQERMARQRGRLVANKWIGQHITGPDIDLALLARSQGALGIGPVERPDALGPAFAEAVESVLGGHVAVVDVRVRPGYEASTTRAMVRPAG